MITEAEKKSNSTETVVNESLVSSAQKSTYACDICHYVTSSQSNYIAHKCNLPKAKLSDKYAFCCDDCRVVFLSSDALSQHMEKYHEGEVLDSIEHQGDSSFDDMCQTNLEPECIVKEEPIESEHMEKRQGGEGVASFEHQGDSSFVDVCQTKLEPECIVKEEPIESEHIEKSQGGEGVASFEHQEDFSIDDLCLTKSEPECIVKEEPLESDMTVIVKQEDIKQESIEEQYADPLSVMKDTSTYAADEEDELKHFNAQGNDVINQVAAIGVDALDVNEMSDLPMPMMIDAMSMIHSQSVVAEESCILPNDSLGFQYSNLNEGQTDNVKNYRCSYCYFLFESKQALNEHIKTLHVMLSCDLCEYVTYEKSRLTGHKRTKHKKDDRAKKYRCDLCDFATTHKSRLPVHIRAKHKKQTQKIDSTPSIDVKKDGCCSLCDFVPDSTEGMNNHIRTSHNDVMVSCDLCEYVTLHKSLLTVHKRARHTVTFGYVPTNESKKSSLLTKPKSEKHYAPTTTKSSYLDYKCDICKCIYITQAGLDEHVKMQHPK